MYFRFSSFSRSQRIKLFDGDFFYLPKARGVDWLHEVLAAKVHVVEVDDVPGDAHSLAQLVVLLQPAEGGGGGVGSEVGGGRGAGGDTDTAEAEVAAGP